jgi:hypothetical protein
MIPKCLLPEVIGVTSDWSERHARHVSIFSLDLSMLWTSFLIAYIHEEKLRMDREQELECVTFFQP